MHHPYCAHVFIVAAFIGFAGCAPQKDGASADKPKIEEKKMEPKINSAPPRAVKAPLIPVNATTPFKVVGTKKIIEALPDGKRWIKHLKEDLLKFWDKETALGDPIGNFPTYRCNDGSLYNVGAPCPELKNADKSIVKLDRDYTRAKSRQVFAYGIAYHLTGEAKYLTYAVAGADWLMNNAMDENGAASWFVNGKAEPQGLERTSQDMAYAVSGLGFLYYLTRSDKYLDAVVKLKDYIFKTYWDESWGLMRWVKAPNRDGDRVDQKELVAQLDQIYGYMLWITMALPDGEMKAQWTADLKRLAVAMRDQFFGDTYGLYFGAITDMAHRNLSNFDNVENPHTDFGHSIKTLWLTYRIGLLSETTSLVNFARPRMYSIIDHAYIEETGSWARGYKPSAEPSEWEIDPDKEWWSLAELDQTSATLALVDPIFADKLSRTYDYWFNKMVDHDSGGVWHMVRADGDVPDLSIPKQHSWKNAFHVFEHALIGYLTSEQLHDSPIVLHYAFEKEREEENIHPYLYFGEIKDRQASKPFETEMLRRYVPTRITFVSLR